MNTKGNKFYQNTEVRPIVKIDFSIAGITL